MAPELQALRAEVCSALLANPPSIPAKLHYDERGSQLFEEICEQPEYYVTRTEVAIMERHARDMAEVIGPNAALIEPGSGASVKTEVLLEAIESCGVYVPLDISDSMLEIAAARVAAKHPSLPVEPVHADFLQPMELPDLASSHANRVVYFPGSTIGNFTVDTQLAVLRAFAAIAGGSGSLLIGFDRVKDIERMEAAYNDAAGVTAEFNLNLIDRLGGDFGLDISREDFEFRAVWDPELEAIVSHVTAQSDVELDVDGTTLDLPRGTRIKTEESHKYTPERIESLARTSGLRVERTWTDSADDFAVVLLRPS